MVFRKLFSSLKSSSGQKLKLTYFNIAGRGEASRLILSYGNIPFEDERVEFSDLPKLREERNLPFSQLPVLKINDDEVLAQSHAIETYAAKLAGIYPQDPLEAARADMMMNAINDLLNEAVVIVYLSGDKTDDERQALIEAFLEQTMPKIFAGVEKNIKTKYLATETSSHADFLFYATFKHVVMAIKGFSWEAYPKAKAVFDALDCEPKLKAYMDKHHA